MSRSDIEKTMQHMEVDVRNSTIHLFERSDFYQDLPPRLQHNLVMSALYFEARKFKYFFDDEVDNFKASEGLKVAILTQLNASLYERGEVVIPFNHRVENMILIASG